MPRMGYKLSASTLGWLGYCDLGWLRFCGDTGNLSIHGGVIRMHTYNNINAMGKAAYFECLHLYTNITGSVHP